MEPPAGKRQKVLIACEPCRTRKAKCDGSTPVCGPCGRRVRKTNIRCTWSDSSHSQSSEARIQALQERIAFLESRPKPAAEAEEAGLDALGSTLRTRMLHSDSGSNEDAQHSANLSARVPRQIDRSSPTCPIIGPVESDERGESFFGSSSAETFMQSVNALVEQRLRGIAATKRPLIQPLGNGLVAFRSPGRGCPPPRAHSAEHSLPLRHTADELMNVYWLEVHSVLPILDRRQIQQEYELLWTGDDDSADQSLFLCLINAIFALSCQMNRANAPQERAHMAGNYYSRAMALLDIWQTPSVRMIQSLILLATFAQSSNEPHQCWILASIAIRISQALGIHLPGTSERAKDTRTQEFLRLVWHACVQLDRTVSMTYGRPCGVGERLATAVPLPSSANCEQALDIPATTMEYFNLSVKLYRNLHEILYSLCAPGVIQAQSLDKLYDRYFKHVPTDPSRASIIDIEGDLQRWHDSIPAVLRATAFDSASEESLVRRQAIILEQNYLHVHLLLLRPFLSAVIALDPSIYFSGEQSASTPLTISISLRCATTCVRVAQDAIKIVQIHRPRTVGDVGSTATWWLNVLFIYTAATVLNASLLCPHIVEELTEAAILESWRFALAILDDYTVFGEHTKRLATTLRVLFDTIPKQRFRQRRRRSQQEQRAQSRPLATSSGASRAVSHTVANTIEPSAAATSQMHSNAFQIPFADESFDFGLSVDDFWDSCLNPLDLTWLTSPPTNL